MKICAVGAELCQAVPTGWMERHDVLIVAF